MVHVCSRKLGHAQILNPGMMKVSEAVLASSMSSIVGSNGHGSIAADEELAAAAPARAIRLEGQPCLCILVASSDGFGARFRSRLELPESWTAAALHDGLVVCVALVASWTLANAGSAVTGDAHRYCRCMARRAARHAQEHYGFVEILVQTLATFVEPCDVSALPGLPSRMLAAIDDRLVTVDGGLAREAISETSDCENLFDKNKESRAPGR